MTGEKPNCYRCVHRLTVPGSCHSRCNNHAAKVSGKKHGVMMGWFFWPVNYDPVWLEQCDGFSANPQDTKPRQELDPATELLGMMR